jgi:hypothetical protein
MTKRSGPGRCGDEDRPRRIGGVVKCPVGGGRQPAATNLACASGTVVDGLDRAKHLRPFLRQGKRAQHAEPLREKAAQRRERFPRQREQNDGIAPVAILIWRR